MSLTSDGFSDVSAMPPKVLTGRPRPRASAGRLCRCASIMAASGVRRAPADNLQVSTKPSPTKRRPCPAWAGRRYSAGSGPGTRTVATLNRPHGHQANRQPPDRAANAVRSRSGGRPRPSRSSPHRRRFERGRGVPALAGNPVCAHTAPETRSTPPVNTLRPPSRPVVMLGGRAAGRGRYRRPCGRGLSGRRRPERQGPSGRRSAGGRRRRRLRWWGRSGAGRWCG